MRVGPVFVYVSRKGVIRDTVYYMYTRNYSRGEASVEYVETIASDKEREEIIEGSFFTSYEEVFKHIEQHNVEEREYNNPNSIYKPYSLHFAPISAILAVDKLVEI